MSELKTRRRRLANDLGSSVYAVICRIFGEITQKPQMSSTGTPKGTSLGENTSFEPSTMEIGSSVRPVEVSKKIIWKERKGKERKAMHKKSQKCYISRSCSGEAPEATMIKFEAHANMVIVVNFAKFDVCILNSLTFARFQK